MYVYYVSIELVTKQCKNWESIFIAMIIISIIDIKLINIDMKNTNSPKDKCSKVIYEHNFKNKNTASVLNE